jgi:uncharacterized protein (DUF433 family)
MTHRIDASTGSFEELITQSKDILGGIPVFTGTRVPVQTLFDYLRAGDPLDKFLEDFPTVSREQVTALLEATGVQLGRAA